MKSYLRFNEKNFLVRNTFTNKCTGQISVTIPKKKFLELFKVEKVPDKISIGIPFNKLNSNGGI